MRLLSLLISLCIISNAKAQSLENHSFFFKGYNTQPVDVVHDNAGHILVVSAISANEEKPLRDPLMNALFDSAFTLNQRTQHCLVMLMDSAFSVKSMKIFHFSPAKALFDQSANKFWIGGSEISLNAALDFSWQITFAGVEMSTGKWKYNRVDVPYSCLLKDMTLAGDTLLMLARNDDDSTAIQKPFLLRMNTRTNAVKQPDNSSGMSAIISRYAFSTTCLITSSLQQSGNSFYFSASSCAYAQGKGWGETPGMSICSYSKGCITQKVFTGTGRSPFYTNLVTTKDGNLILSYVPSAESREFILQKVDTDLKPAWKIKVPDETYPDFYNDFFEMPGGRIVAIAANKQKTWSYFVYTANGEFVKEIDSKQSSSLYVRCMKAWSATELICSFAPASNAEAAFIQVVKI